MEITVYNPQKGRLETIHAEYTKENTTWFDYYHDNSDVFSITDVKGGLIIKDYDYTYPILVYDISRAENLARANDNLGIDPLKIDV